MPTDVSERMRVNYSRSLPDLSNPMDLIQDRAECPIYGEH